LAPARVVARAEKAEDARNVRYYRERVESAVEVDPAGQPAIA